MLFRHQQAGVHKGLEELRYKMFFHSPTRHLRPVGNYRKVSPNELYGLTWIGKRKTANAGGKSPWIKS